MTSEPAPARTPAPADRAAHLYLVRHGEFPSNTRGLLDTSLPGGRLTELGTQQAAGAAAQLREFGCTATVIHHSEAARARHTAEIIGGALERPTLEVPGVFEVQAGELEKRGDPDALATYRSHTHAWMRGYDLDVAIPGGESGTDVRNRVFPRIEELYRGHVAEGRDAVIVVHGTLIRVVGALLGAVHGEFPAQHAVPNCGIIGLVPSGEGVLAGAAAWTCDDWAGQDPERHG